MTRAGQGPGSGAAAAPREDGQARGRAAPPGTRPRRYGAVHGASAGHDDHGDHGGPGRPRLNVLGVGLRPLRHGDHGAPGVARVTAPCSVAAADHVWSRRSRRARRVTAGTVGHGGHGGDWEAVADGCERTCWLTRGQGYGRRDRHHIPHPIQGLEVGKPPSPTKAYIAVASARGGCAQCHHETRYYHPTTYQPRHTVQVARCVLGDAGVSKASARSPQRRKRGPASGSNRAVLKRGAYCARVTSRALVSRALGARPRQMGSSCRPLPSLASSPLTA